MRTRQQANTWNDVNEICATIYDVASYPFLLTWIDLITWINATLPQDTFSCYFQNIHKCTISTKLRDFQYRLLNQAVITNTHLFKWKIIQADLCTFCEEQPESILHLLVKCKHSQLIWNKLFVKLHTLTGIYIQFTEKEQSLGITNFQYQDLFNLSLPNNIYMPADV